MAHGDASLRAELHRAGLRVTEPRRAVLEWLADHPHSTAEQIGGGVRERIGSVSTQAIYNVLIACSRAGLVRWIEPAGHPARYERRTGDNHHHLVCRGCGRITDVDCVAGRSPCLKPGGAGGVDLDGFDLQEAEVLFWGRCRRCAAGPES